MTALVWHGAAVRIAGSGERGVLVTAARVRGSAPCAPGSRMVVAGDDAFGTIGGGTLELLAMETARDMLSAPVAAPLLSEENPLGPDLDQCCGGSVLLVYQLIDGDSKEWLDRWAALTESDGAAVMALSLDPKAPKIRFFEGAEWDAAPIAAPQVETLNETMTVIGPGPSVKPVLIERLENPLHGLWLFGAGHVGQAVVRALEPLPFHVTWVDGRAGALAPETGVKPTARLTLRPAPAPHREAASIPAGASVLILTHSHKLDLDICAAVLSRDDLGLVGLIGSAAKRSRFRRLLSRRGLSEAALNRLVCPIGLPGIAGKAPAVIAASVAAQLLAWRTTRAAKESPQEKKVRPETAGRQAKDRQQAKRRKR